MADNYIYLLLNDAAPEAAVVDPAAADSVLAYLNKTRRRLVAILNTHHHADHTGGNAQLLRRCPGVAVYGSLLDRGRISGQSFFLRDGDEITVVGAKAKILEVPGHTRAHIAYFFADDAGGGDLFSGDTVFGATIGNIFEATPEVMFESINKIRSLPLKTRIWCAHEYTLQYVRESAAIDPHNARLAKRLKELEARGNWYAPTVPLVLEEECATNPFFRWDDPHLAAHLATKPGFETFRRLCEIT